MAHLAVDMPLSFYSTSCLTLVFDMHFNFSIRTILVLVWVEISVLWARLLPNDYRKHWIVTLSLVYNIKYDRQQYMIWFLKWHDCHFFLPCCFNYHLKLHTFSHEIKSSRNKLKSMEHHLFHGLDIILITMAIINIEIISCALNCMCSILFWNAVISCTTEFGYNEYAA